MTTLLAAPPKPSDPTQGPDRPWPGMPPPSFAIGAPPKPSNPTPSDPPKPSQPRPTSVFAMATDDMPVPTDPGPRPAPTPKPGVLRSTASTWLVLVAACVMLTLGLACLSTVLTGWSPLNFNEWLVAYIALAGLAVSRLAPAPKRPSRPVRRATRSAFDSLLRRLVVRAGWLLLRAPVRT